MAWGLCTLKHHDGCIVTYEDGAAIGLSKACMLGIFVSQRATALR